MSLRDDFAEDTFENRMVHEAIRSTEREIFHDAFDEDPPDDGVSAWEDEAWDTEDIHGERHSDAEQMNELAGEDDEPQQQYQAPQPVYDPQPDLFEDPHGHSEWLLRQAAANHLPGLVYAAPHLGPKPDMFADPEAHDQWMLSAMGAMAGINERATEAFNAQFATAHETHGDDFASAWNALHSLPLHTRRAAVAELAQVAQRGGNAGEHLVSQFIQARAQAEHAQKNGLPYRRELLRELPVDHARRASARGFDYAPPATREEAVERAIFNSAFD